MKLDVRTFPMYDLSLYSRQYYFERGVYRLGWVSIGIEGLDFFALIPTMQYRLYIGLLISFVFSSCICTATQTSFA